MTIVLIFVVAASVTFLLRSSITLAGDRVLRAPRVEAAIALLSPAVLAAMIASALVLQQGLVSAPSPAEVSAIVAGAMAARRTGNPGMALVAGLPLHSILVAAGLG